MDRRKFLLSTLALAASGCSDPRSHRNAVYMLVDTSGTYAREAGKALLIVNYLLGTLEPGAVAEADLEPRHCAAGRGHRDLVAGRVQIAAERHVDLRDAADPRGLPFQVDQRQCALAAAAWAACSIRWSSWKWGAIPRRIVTNRPSGR